jgi:hypothetical protein
VQLKLPFAESTAFQVPQWEQLEESQRTEIVERLARLIEKAVTNQEEEKEKDD